MASNGFDHLIFRPEKAGLWDLLGLVFSSKNLADYDFVETNCTNLPPTNFITRVLILIFLIYSIISSSISEAANKFKAWMEYSLNELNLNGGLLGLLYHTITGSIVRPDPEAANYRSFRSFEFGKMKVRTNLMSSVKLALSLDEVDRSYHDNSVMELAALASILAYENEARIKDTVVNNWKMYFVEFFECWNMAINAYETEAFICCDKEEDPQLIIVAFRGTSDLDDWRCDFDLSLIKMGEMGMVHLGFMTSLGLDTEKACSGNDWNVEKGFPKEYTGSKPLAYYSIRKVLKDLVEKNKNAKILITGHSLGGALTILYTSLLVMQEEEDILSRISWVMTFGQPRVGDAMFGDTMLKIIGTKYIRLVYRYDIVPRIPFELPFLLKFIHFGDCINYNGWYSAEKVEKLPNKNYFNILYGLIMFWGAVVDLLRAIWEITGGEWEGFTAIFLRLFWTICPGVGFHNTRDYLNSVRMATLPTNTPIKEAKAESAEIGQVRDLGGE
ncbi:hypothetical protein J5N97_014384 [Dioscorea zingiberensis]|uniref:Fungal lipase-type domain-containing protein n=1 Tax=Dioscorea zingiberensis TaxID=325984 RepID=A0A9D5CV38_9LILI|nr:hypothetical protein J5N97_014384 [Dioscorea zingiberensis]